MMLDLLCQLQFPAAAWFSWGVLPLLIFMSRICDVTIGTARVIFVTRGYKYMASAAGFFEVLIWIMVIGQVMQNLSNPACFIAYAAGFAVGNYVGIRLAEKMSLGFVLVRVLFNKDVTELITTIRNAGFGVTSFDGHGAYGPVKEIFTVLSRRQVKEFLDIIKAFEPDAFYLIAEVGTVSKDYPMSKKTLFDGILTGYRPFRKGK